MKKLAVLLIFLGFISTQSCISTSEVNAEKLNVFPTVTGTDLHGEDITLP